jgi:hypothetical protein
MGALAKKIAGSSFDYPIERMFMTPKGVKFLSTKHQTVGAGIAPLMKLLQESKK